MSVTAPDIVPAEALLVVLSPARDIVPDGVVNELPVDDVESENEPVVTGGPGTGVRPGMGGRSCSTEPAVAVVEERCFSPPSSCTPGAEVAVCDSIERSVVTAARPLASMLEEVEPAFGDVSASIASESVAEADGEVR